MKLDEIDIINEEETSIPSKRARRIAEQEVEVTEKKTINKDKLFIIEAGAGIAILLILIGVAIFLLVGKGDKKKDTETSAAVITEDISESQSGETEAITADKEASDEDASVSDSALTSDSDKENDNGVASTVKDVTAPQTVKGELSQIYEAGKMYEYTKDNYQLPELFAYWDDYQLEAVEDLIRLERVRTITDALGKSNDFYYYGSTDSKGQPDGKGLAVYAYNTYYFGEWKSGKREGNGMWLRIFPDEPGILNGVKGVLEHQYNGKWANDLPCGEGQEHVEYDTSKINKEFTISNAIGEFVDGYYNGSMYIMTIDERGNTIDWYGTAEKGSFVFINNKKNNLGKRSIWEAGDGYKTEEEDNCRWIMPKDNLNFGVSGLKK